MASTPTPAGSDPAGHEEEAARPRGPLGAPPRERDFESAVRWMRQLRDIDERPGEGLRERKKRLTRQEISDTASWMFCERGFDQVRVADVAERVGVSEKTIFNYFPTKEAMVFDREEALTASLVAALRDRPRGESPIQAVLALITREWLPFTTVPADGLWMFQAFSDMVRDTPALHAAQQAMSDRMTASAARALAEGAQLDPSDPEPLIVAHALMGMWQVTDASAERHVDAGLSGAALAAAIEADAARAGRLLETGLWSFNLFTQGKRAAGAGRDGAKALKEAQAQVHKALRDAREAFRSARDLHVEALREQRREERRDRRRGDRMEGRQRGPRRPPGPR